MKKALKITWNVFFWLIVTVIIGALIIFIVGSKLSKDDNSVSFFGYRWYKILTSSMFPGINAGDVVFVKTNIDTENLSSDDVITFNTTANKDAVLTHRIFSADKTTDGKVYYKTKGDANKAIDAMPVQPDDIIGKVQFTVPKLGKVIDFVKEHFFATVAIIILAIVIICVLPIIFCSRKDKRKHEEDKEELQN